MPRKKLNLEKNKYGLIDSNQVADLLGKEDIKILDLRSEGKFEEGHIPGAIKAHISSFNDPDNQVPFELATQSQFERAMSFYGIREEDTIIIYSDLEDPCLTTRLFWSLQAYGHDKAYILDGHYEAWIKSEGQVEEGTGQVIEATAYKVTMSRPEINVNLQDVLALLRGEAEGILVDTRPIKAYMAKTPAVGANARGGHIPGAINIPFALAWKSDGTFKKPEDLAHIFKDQGLNKEDRIILSCQTGNTATTIYFALKQILAYENVSIYDGSYVEWSNKPDLEVEYSED